VEFRALVARDQHAVEVDIIIDGETITVTGEVAQQIGEGRVRCVCMKPTDGLVRVPSCARPVEGLPCPSVTPCSTRL